MHSTIETATARTVQADLSLTQLHLMRAGYALLGLGLAIVQWPSLVDAASFSLFEGVTLCMLSAMSLLALVGLRHPVRLLPLLLFETAWKVLWLAVRRASEGVVRRSRHSHDPDHL